MLDTSVVVPVDTTFAFGPVDLCAASSVSRPPAAVVAWPLPSCRVLRSYPAPQSSPQSCPLPPTWWYRLPRCRRRQRKEPAPSVARGFAMVRWCRMDHPPPVFMRGNSIYVQNRTRVTNYDRYRINFDQSRQPTSGMNALRPEDFPAGTYEIHRRSRSRKWSFMNRIDSETIRNGYRVVE